MLISVTLENWMSFRDPATFSMVAGDEKNHSDRLIHIEKYNFDLLPISIIFGSNGSGKSNFIAGINFARNIIRGYSFRSKVTPFKLDEISRGKASRFVFVVLIKDSVYEYSFSVSTDGILKEELSERKADDKLEKIFLFDSENPSDFYLKDGLFSLKENETEGFSAGLVKSKRKAQLFLNFLKELVIETPDIVNSIRELLGGIQIITPHTGRHTRHNHKEYDKLSSFMRDIDSGISHLGIEDTPLDKVDLPEEIKDDIKQSLDEKTEYEGSSPWFWGLSNGSFIKTKDGIVSRRLRSFHKSKEGNDIPFDIDDESDGTQRIFSIAPLLLELFENSDKNKIVFIDELDRSLHSLLSHQLVKSYLVSCSKATKKQLIFTTHDIDLMDTDLLRLDELWITERQGDGNSTLTSLVEFDDIQSNEDIRQSYKEGRFGGIPKLFNRVYS